MRDRFLPPDGNENSWIRWVEATTDKYEHEPIENDAFTMSEVETNWLNKLFAKDYSPDTAARIISRAFRMYTVTGKIRCFYCQGMGVTTWPNPEPCFECRSTGKIDSITFKAKCHG